MSTAGLPGTTLIENPGAPIHRSIAIFDDFLGFAHLWIFLDCSQNVNGEGVNSLEVSVPGSVPGSLVGVNSTDS